MSQGVAVHTGIYKKHIDIYKFTHAITCRKDYIYNITTIIYGCHMDISAHYSQHSITAPLAQPLGVALPSRAAGWGATLPMAGEAIQGMFHEFEEPLANQQYFMGRSWENHQ